MHTLSARTFKSVLAEGGVNQKQVRVCLHKEVLNLIIGKNKILNANNTGDRYKMPMNSLGCFISQEVFK